MKEKNKLQHDLVKTDDGWKCKVCNLEWKRKPTKACVGLKAIGYFEKPRKTLWESDAGRNNLRLKSNSVPVAYHHKQSGKHEYCYRLKDYEKKYSSIPDLILTKKAKDEQGYKTLRQLEKQNLKPIKNARKCAVYYWDKETGDDFAVFYHQEDTEFCPADNLFTKTTLKKTYLLSDSWIKRLGDADKITYHETYGNAIYLYSRKRLENFLANNAEEYSKWLNKRDRMVANAIPMVEANEIRRNQQKQCLQCASGCMTSKGFICAIYPTGLTKDKIPCPDFCKRLIDTE